MKDFICKNRLIIIFTVLGAAGGFLYWKYVGCLSGTCRIKSVWYFSTLYGAALGYIAGDILKSILLWNKRRKDKAEDSTV